MTKPASNKIIVVGCPGSGKSVFSRKLAALVDLPLFHLDSVYHQDIWPHDAAHKREKWRHYVQGIVEQDRWIIDGNYKGTFDIRMTAADTVIFLDYPRRITVLRLLKRRVEFNKRQRPDMPPNWQEKISWDFFRFVWTYRSKERPRVLDLLDQHREGREIIILRSPREADLMLEGNFRSRAVTTGQNPRAHAHPIDDVIAEQKLIAVIGDERREVTLQIGRPYVDADDVARCPVAAWGLDDRYPDVAGGGTLHALNVACGLLERRLLDSVSAGMKFFLPNCEEEGELSAKFFTMTMFGRMMVKQPRKPKDNRSTEQQESPR